MATAFLGLPEQDRAAILNTEAANRGVAAAVLEKDIWVCWVLRALFGAQGLPPMAFKGGTSLSKVYGAINRFSEDVDVAIDHHHLLRDFDPFAPDMTRARMKKQLLKLKDETLKLIRKQVAPVLLESYRRDFDSALSDFDIDEDVMALKIPFASAVEQVPYVQPIMLLEFGGRSPITPGDVARVQSYIAPDYPALEFPTAQVHVLAAERTFWEKATLIHVDCNRGVQVNAARQSRHWYDLARLADMEHGKRALEDRALLEDVLRYKEAFFKGNQYNYDDCRIGKFRLIPDSEGLNKLRLDFEVMINAGMFFETPPGFDVIIERLRQLESDINQRR